MFSPPDPRDRMELFMTEVRVFDWPGTVRWYVETFGLRILVNDEPNGFVLLAAGQSRLALRRGVARCEAVYHTRLHFRVPDVDAERARLLAAGVAVSEPVENDRESYREVRLTDPEGTAITLFTWSKPAQ
jgi:predicted enzyme related to lactoylglutathione lyase